jgi:hypothetical protein
MTTTTIVIHVRPDLDALLGAWIMCRFGHLDSYNLVFVPVGHRLKEGENIIHIDTGLTQFDHHGRSDFTCAAKLVYDALFKGKPNFAVEKLVEYALKTDWYLLGESEDTPFSVNSVIEGHNYLFPNNPHKVAENSFCVFDALYASLSVRVKAEKEYNKGFSFNSSFGEAFAIESDNTAVRDVAYRKGAVLFVFVDPIKGYRGFKAQSQKGIDLTQTFIAVNALEPHADWFLHSSRELLLCGSDKAPDRKLSSLSISELAALVSSDTLKAKNTMRHKPSPA